MLTNTRLLYLYTIGLGSMAFLMALAYNHKLGLTLTFSSVLGLVLIVSQVIGTLRSITRLAVLERAGASEAILRDLRKVNLALSFFSFSLVIVLVGPWLSR